jgi:beta-glucosidase
MKPVVEPGEFEIQIGSSSDRIHFNKTILVK